MRLNAANYLIMQIHIKRDPQHIGISHSTDTDYKDFMEIYRKCTRRPYSFLNIDATLPADIPLRFRKNLLDSI